MEFRDVERLNRCIHERRQQSLTGTKPSPTRTALYHIDPRLSGDGLRIMLTKGRTILAQALEPQNKVSEVVHLQNIKLGRTLDREQRRRGTLTGIDLMEMSTISLRHPIAVNWGSHKHMAGRRLLCPPSRMRGRPMWWGPRLKKWSHHGTC